MIFRKKRLIFTFLIVLFCILLSNCSMTPYMRYAVDDSPEISEQSLTYQALQQVLKKLIVNLDLSKKYLLVQPIDDLKNDYICNLIYEELLVIGFNIDKIREREMSTIDKNKYDKFLYFYPIVYGTEKNYSVPTGITNYLVGSIPILGTMILKQYNYKTTYIGVVLRFRLYDPGKSKIIWIKKFTGYLKTEIRENTDILEYIKNCKK